MKVYHWILLCFTCMAMGFSGGIVTYYYQSDYHQPESEKLISQEITTWEDGRRWLREKGWRLAELDDGDSGVRIWIDKEVNGIDCNIRKKAKTDLEVIRKAIEHVKTFSK